MTIEHGQCSGMHEIGNGGANHRATRYYAMLFNFYHAVISVNHCLSQKSEAPQKERKKTYLQEQPQGQGKQKQLSSFEQGCTCRKNDLEAYCTSKLTNAHDEYGHT